MYKYLYAILFVVAGAFSWANADETMTPAQAAAAAALANPDQAAQIAAQAAAEHPDQAAEIVKAVLAVCPACAGLGDDPVKKRACASVSMDVVNAVIAAAPDQTENVIAAASGAPGYDPGLLNAAPAAGAGAAGGAGGAGGAGAGGTVSP